MNINVWRFTETRKVLWGEERSLLFSELNVTDGPEKLFTTDDLSQFQGVITTSRRFVFYTKKDVLTLILGPILRGGNTDWYSSADLGRACTMITELSGQDCLGHGITVVAETAHDHHVTFAADDTGYNEHYDPRILCSPYAKLIARTFQCRVEFTGSWWIEPPR